MSIIARTSSSVSCSILFTSCEMRKPSKKWRKGTRASSVAAWAIRAMSCASCTDAAESIAQPVERQAITSLWSPKIERAWVAMVRAVTWKTVGGEFPGDLEHVGDHQQQALGGREGGRQGPGLQRPVDGPRRAGLALHFHHQRHGAEGILASGRRPGIRHFAQPRRGGDRVNRHHLVAQVGYVGRRFIAVDGHEASFLHGSSPQTDGKEGSECEPPRISLSGTGLGKRPPDAGAENGERARGKRLRNRKRAAAPPSNP